MTKFPIRFIGTEFNLLVSIQGNSVLLTCSHCDQFLYPEAARHLAEILCEAADQVDYEMEFDRKCAAIVKNLTPIQLKLLEEKLSAVKESDQ